MFGWNIARGKRTNATYREWGVSIETGGRLTTIIFNFGSSFVRCWRVNRDHYLAERYGMEEKPEGWNRDVLGWFFRGPERREKTPEFSSAFAERAREVE
jgi:hypothetical protein